MQAYHQNLDPLHNQIVSTLFAAMPVLVLFWLLVPKRWLAPKAGLAGAIAAIVIAWIVYRMPLEQATMAFIHGAAFGMLPVGWTIFFAMLLYNITVETGQFNVIRRSIAGLSADARVQAILIGFSFGAFLEGAAGGGTPVAICGAIMVGLGFHPFLAAVLCLIANTSPVAYGGLGTPLITLNGATDLDTFTLSMMAGRQLPFMSIIVPLWMVRCMCNWRQTFAVWPVLAVTGGSFAIFQFVFSHLEALYPMTDIGGGIFSLIVTAIFLRFWKPKELFHYLPTEAKATPKDREAITTDPHAAEAMAMMESAKGDTRGNDVPLTTWNVTKAWMPYILMSVFLLGTGYIRAWENKAPVYFGPIRTNYLIDIPFLHNQVYRDPQLLAKRPETAPVSVLASSSPLETAVALAVATDKGKEAKEGQPAQEGIWTKLAPKPEKAQFNFVWLTAPGTAVLFAALVSMAMLSMNPTQIVKVLRRTVIQMKIPIPTIACMLGLSYVTKYAGMDATLGIAFALSGVAYPFFAAILGWLGVFLTGTDAGSNALFGSQQKITATSIAGSVPLLSLEQTQVLICTANSTGGVMGKMIDAQSICVATAATHQLGKEADIFKAVVWHSIILAALVGLIVLVQAYVYPFTLMVPSPPAPKPALKQGP